MGENVARRRRFGDRADGYLLRGVDPMFRLLPFIMKKRSESAVYFTYDMDITETERFMRDKRRTAYAGLSYTHLFWAAMVRSMALHPKVNRFVAGNRVYARRFIRLAMTVRKSRADGFKEYQIVEDFDPFATLYEVARQFDDKMAELEVDAVNANEIDHLINLLTRGPRLLNALVVRVARCLDYFGLLPQELARTTPFFTSAFLSNMGSLGAEAVHHHLYEVGTTTMFISFGKKRTVYTMGRDGTVEARRLMCVKCVVDERICNGADYAAALTAFRHLLEHPERLLEPPEALGVDDEI